MEIGMETLSVVMITFNEEKNLAYALESVQGLANEVVIVDSGSTDKTIEIARNYGARVYSRVFDNFSKQRNFSLKETGLIGDWILVIDADEYLTYELKEEIQNVLNSSTGEDAFLMKRRFYWMGKWIKHGYYPVWLLRFGRRGYIECDDRGVNEHLICSTDNIGSFKNDFIDHNRKNLSAWFEKHNKYAELEAYRIINDKNQGYSFFGSQYQRKRWIRVHIWNKFPLFVRPFVLLFYRLFIKLGFLDGRRAVFYHFLHAFFYRFLIDAKLFEIKNKK